MWLFGNLLHSAKSTIFFPKYCFFHDGQNGFASRVGVSHVEHVSLEFLCPRDTRFVKIPWTALLLLLIWTTTPSTKVKIWMFEQQRCSLGRLLIFMLWFEQSSGMIECMMWPSLGVGGVRPDQINDLSKVDQGLCFSESDSISGVKCKKQPQRHYHWKHSPNTSVSSSCNCPVKCYE